MLGVSTLEQPDVHVEPGAGRELLEEARDHVAREPADELAREVDVRDDERPLRDLDDDPASASSAGRYAQPRPDAPSARSGSGERPPSARPAAATSSSAAPRRDLERDPQAAAAGELADEVVEHGQARRDGRLALGRELDPHAGLRCRPSA